MQKHRIHTIENKHTKQGKKNVKRILKNISLVIKK